MEKFKEFLRRSTFLEVFVIFAICIAVFVMLYLTLKPTLDISYNPEKTTRESVPPALGVANTTENISYSLTGEEDLRVSYDTERTKHSVKTTPPVSRVPSSPSDSFSLAKSSVSEHGWIQEQKESWILRKLESGKVTTPKRARELYNLAPYESEAKEWAKELKGQLVLEELRSDKVVTPERARELYYLAPFGSVTKEWAKEVMKQLIFEEFASGKVTTPGRAQGLHYLAPF